MKNLGLTIAALTTLLMAGCTEEVSCSLPSGETGTSNGEVTIETNFGNMTVEVFTKKAPITGGNFLSLVDSGYYDGTVFHRAIRDFMIQGGDPTGTGRGGEAHADYADAQGNIPDEFHTDLRHDDKGILSMANAGQNTGSSQFFIITGPTPNLDGLNPDGSAKDCANRFVSCHAVFGKVTDGIDVLDRINEEAARPGSDGSNGVPPYQEIQFLKGTARCL